ncbi:MAG: hypothetical protein WC789_11100 [Lentisphaeria bacterium]|jgi:hypothetical protein
MKNYWSGYPELFTTSAAERHGPPKAAAKRQRSICMKTDRSVPVDQKNLRFDFVSFVSSW